MGLIDRLPISIDVKRRTCVDTRSDGFESPNAGHRCEAFDAVTPRMLAKTLYTVEVPQVPECTLCLLSIPCNVLLEFLDSVNGIVDRGWGEVVLEDGLYEC